MDQITEAQINAFVATLKCLDFSRIWSPAELVDKLEFKGFDRRAFFMELIRQKIDLKAAAFCSVLGALRGNNFEKWGDTIDWSASGMVNLRSKLSKNVVGKRGKAEAKYALTLSRFTSAMPEVAAYFLLKAEVKKRFDVPCPAHLQFPGAALLPLTSTLRPQHKAFSIELSKVLPGGSSANQSQIYDTISANTISWVDLNTHARAGLSDYLELPTKEIQDGDNSPEAGRLRVEAAGGALTSYGLLPDETEEEKKKRLEMEERNDREMREMHEAHEREEKERAESEARFRKEWEEKEAERKAEEERKAAEAEKAAKRAAKKP